MSMKYFDEDEYFDDDEIETPSDANLLADKYPETFTVEVKIADILDAAVGRTVAHESWRTHVDGLVYEIVKKRVREYAEKEARRIAEEKFREAVDSIVADGFQATDAWGNPRGEPRTLKSLILAALDRQNNSESLLETTVSEAVRVALAELVKAHIPDLKAKIEKQLDMAWATAVVDAIKSKFKI